MCRRRAGWITMRCNGADLQYILLSMKVWATCAWVAGRFAVLLFPAAALHCGLQHPTSRRPHPPQNRRDPAPSNHNMRIGIYQSCALQQRERARAFECSQTHTTPVKEASKGERQHG